MQILAQETTTEPGIRKWFTRDNLIILVLAGVLLFVIALPAKETESQSKTTDILGTQESASLDSAGVVVAGQSSETGSNTALDVYAREQEAKLEKLLASMNGVGNVEVMLTFVSSEELVVEKDTPTVRSNTVEKDSAGGNRTVSQFETGDTTVYSSASGTSTPYVVKTLNPRVEGVVIVAQGASDETVSRNISEAVQALFGVEAGRIKVVDMGSRGSTLGSVSGLSGN